MTEPVILLVEDNPDHADLTLRALRKNNIVNDVVVATDGVEAIDYLFRTGKYENNARWTLPRLVILDLKLPRLGGLDVLKKLRSDERTRLLPVVILTSSNEERDLLDGYGLGANSYVRKPINFNDFAEAVRQLGLYWLILNEPVPKRTTAT
ncbi:MAG: response regulator [Euryarchaeota archaeon]|nr:response regulator [Euryarchaeota archaeon]